MMITQKANTPLTLAQRRALVTVYAYGELSARTPGIVRADTLRLMKQRGLIVYVASCTAYQLTNAGNAVVDALLSQHRQSAIMRDWTLK